MYAPSIVLVARPDHANALRRRAGGDTTAAVFADFESLQAIEAILARPPRMVALDPTFVSTARGAALVARLKAEPHLSHVDVRVLGYDEDGMPLLLGQKASAWEAALHKVSLPLDRVGTRLTVRFAVHQNVHAVINGESCQLVDLSPTGAQALVATRFRPDQPLRLTLSDKSSQVSCRAVVAWSVAEPKGSVVQYRIGVKFLEADTKALEAFVWAVYEASASSSRRG